MGKNGLPLLVWCNQAKQQSAELKRSWLFKLNYLCLKYYLHTYILCNYWGIAFLIKLIISCRSFLKRIQLFMLLYRSGSLKSSQKAKYSFQQIEVHSKFESICCTPYKII